MKGCLNLPSKYLHGQILQTNQQYHVEETRNPNIYRIAGRQ